MKSPILLQMLVPDQQSTTSERLLHEFRASAELAAFRALNLTEIGNKVLPNMPQALRVECHMDGEITSNNDPPFTMEFYEGDKYFGAISARARLSNNKIWLYDMVYEANIKGFAPYAMRHFVDAFRDFKQLVLATGVMADPKKCKKFQGDDKLTVEQAEHAKLKNFNRLGFQLIEEANQQRMGLPESHNHIRGCRAVFPFNDAETRASVFRNLEMPSDAELSAKIIRLPGRSKYAPQPAIGHKALA